MMKNEQSRKYSYIIFIIIIFCLGIGLIVGASIITNRNSTLLKTYIKTDAVVFDYVTSQSLDENRYTKYKYAEIAEFSVEGVKYKVINKISSSTPKKIGSHLIIAYNPDNPQDCLFLTSENQIVVILMFILGFCFIIAVICMLYGLIRDRNLT